MHYLGQHVLDLGSTGIVVRGHTKPTQRIERFAGSGHPFSHDHTVVPACTLKSVCAISYDPYLQLPSFGYMLVQLSDDFSGLIQSGCDARRGATDLNSANNAPLLDGVE